LMFIEVVRRHLENLPPEQAGWLAGLRDPFVGKVLSLMHAAPANSWTIEELARQVGLSRSALAERFADLVGSPPMQYLAKWRMQIASELLSGGNTNVATIAAEIGYESEAAFSRASSSLVAPSACFVLRSSSCVRFSSFCNCVTRSSSSCDRSPHPAKQIASANIAQSCRAQTI